MTTGVLDKPEIEVGPWEIGEAEQARLLETLVAHPPMPREVTLRRVDRYGNHVLEWREVESFEIRDWPRGEMRPMPRWSDVDIDVACRAFHPPLSRNAELNQASRDFYLQQNATLTDVRQRELNNHDIVGNRLREHQARITHARLEHERRNAELDRAENLEFTCCTAYRHRFMYSDVREMMGEPTRLTRLQSVLAAVWSMALIVGMCSAAALAWKLLP